MPTIKEFISIVDGFSKFSGTKKIDYLSYFLQKHRGLNSFSALDIKGVFLAIPSTPNSRTGTYLAEEARKRKGGKYVSMNKNTYVLDVYAYDNIEKELAKKNNPIKEKIEQDLINLESKITDAEEKDFLKESIDCYGVEAYRATIVMVWSLTIAHLQKYVLNFRLKDFNLAISSHSDKKMKQITKYDDFSELKESRLIELMRSAGIISNDVRKILEEKLGTRNSAGHPSTVRISPRKTAEFVEDLVDNVILKY